MKFPHLLVLIFVTLPFLGPIRSDAHPLRQGGVSDGGGNSLGASNVSAQEIADKIPELSFWVFPWIYKNQADLNPQLVVLLKQGSIEIRLSEPCFDKNGTPKDGSIYASQKNQICISALLLSKKLSKSNFESELAALIIHEFSHFFGTTEAEAVSLQKKALEDFAQMNFSETQKKYQSFLAGPQGGLFFKVYGPLENWLQDPKNYTTARDLLYWNQQWGELYGELTDAERGLIQYLPGKSLAAFPAYNLKIAVMIAYYQAQDPQLDPELRKQFQDNLDSSFAKASSTTARDFIKAREGWDPGPDYDQVILSKPVSWADQAQAMKEIVTYLKNLQVEAQAMVDFRFSFSKK
ncbi:hypothetical protein AZI86_00315 [Bdellovibrio bacteriovorus]|uniref:Uncharacterized protein n=1 Tax=Bdellovibrio bacteriovorus TaxID=959 RepID=A0A150WMP6_BDEBC|nr:hypothetical protein [Bdellovibrio bacteriovorus]KYG65559.1 hypothetical protein AZI86_00315 [Bdellovibrio bacteriovorus]